MNLQIGLGTIDSVDSKTYNDRIVITYTSNDPKGTYTFAFDDEGNLLKQVKAEPVIDEDAVYLADKAKVGEYVDIGVSYTNKQGFTSGTTTTTSVLEGWRVLSVSGSGIDGKVTVVSSSCPLTWEASTYNGSWNQAGASSAISTLSDLNNRKITFSSGNYWGFRANGFITSNLESLFGSHSEMVDQESKVHGFTLNEFMAKYQEMTGTEKTLAQMRAIDYPLKLSEMKLLAKDYWDDRYLDLLNNGQTYALFGTGVSNNQLWYVNPTRYNLDGTADPGLYGVRVVITLKPGFKLASGNAGDGKTSATAYKITK